MKKLLALLAVALLVVGCQADTDDASTSDNTEDVTVADEKQQEINTMIEDGHYFEINGALTALTDADLTKEEIDTIKAETAEKLITEVDALSESFMSGDLDVNTYSNTLTDFEIIELDGVPEKAAEARTNNSEMITSRQAFKDGEKFFEIEYYDMAKIEFEKVIDSDVHYEDAQARLEELNNM
ncbi:hypothetical protein SAMN05421839_11916 [Halolactibacillus halophilus]|uniref:Lipoprotein n=1 Tax=Halolactibacillus halophilus TaxID=306540 RepID=A0A1I5Q7X4_9BACI|nr:hypothetical protein [Halolactibacillus halophilus]GEM01628.1 hypothetical protein HHA03_11600 [Halolactibacillus halophilus]SFP41976.1 hypothetical protein SAMN05421839_11916 [Halolactibacillus halophilus]